MLEIYGLIFGCIVGTVGHFLYKLSNKNKLIGFLFSVNESTWEHLKLGITPIVIWGLIELIILKNPPIIIITCIKIIIFTIILIVSYYLYKHLLKQNILILDIAIFYLSMAISFAISSKISNVNYSLIFYILSFIFYILLFFTYKKRFQESSNIFIFKN